MNFSQKLNWPSVIASLASTETTAPVDMNVKKWRKIALTYKHWAHPPSTKPRGTVRFCTTTINFVYQNLFLQLPELKQPKDILQKHLMLLDV